MKSRGADYVVDYNDQSAISEIKYLSGNDLKYVFDCFGAGDAPGFCFDAFGRNGGHYSSLQFPPACNRKDVKTSMVVAYTSFGKFFSKFGRDWPAQPENYEFGSKFFELAEALLAEGKLKPHPVRIGKGGIEGIIGGLATLKAGNVSGEKLVFSI